MEKDFSKEQYKKIVAALKRYLPPRIVEKIENNPDQNMVEAERRKVTIMFADISGFTTLSEKLDPEEVINIVNDFFNRMVRIIQKYGGTVDKFMGDALLVLYGTPVAHEDDPERAVRTALEMQDEMERFNNSRPAAQRKKFPLEMTIGINTGLVIAGNVGSETRMEYTVMGDNVNLAARVEGLANPGEVMITEFTRKGLSSKIKVRDLGGVKVKGKKHPVGMFKVLGIGEAVELSHADFKEVFVDREKELSLLNEYSNNLNEFGSGAGLILQGDTGIGKSSLLTHFLNSRVNKEQIDTYLINTDSFDSSIPYSVILKLLKGIFEISGQDSEMIIKEKILKEITRLGRDLYESMPYINPLFGFEDKTKEELTPEQRKWKIFDTISNILIRKSSFKKFLIAVDDFNFADDLSREFFDILFLEISANPILILLNTKSDLELSSLNDGLIDKNDLDGLSRDNINEMLKEYLEIEYALEDFIDKIFDISHGNPLFVTQIIDNLITEKLIEIKENKLFLTKPLNEIKIPDNVNTIALSKIDALPENHRKFLQYASVFGVIFNGQLVGKMVNFKPGRIVGSLRYLEEKGFIQPSEKEEYYKFIHSTIQESAYETLLKGKRSQLHGKIGLIYEDKFKGKEFENLEVLAYHFGRSSNYKKGIDYLLKAAEKDKELYANYQVIEYCKRALENLKKLSKTKTTLKNKYSLHTIAGEIYKILGNFELALNHFEDALKTAESLKDSSLALDSENWIASTNYAGGDLDNSEKFYSNLYEHSKEKQNKEFESNALMGLGAVYEEKDLEKAMDYYQKAYKIKLILDNQEGISDCLNLIGNVNYKQGKFDEAQKRFENSLQIKRSLKDKIKEARILNNIGLIYSQKGDFTKSNEYYNLALEISTQIGDKPYQATILEKLATNLTGSGKFDEARNCFEKAEYITKLTKDEYLHAIILNQMAMLEEEIGNYSTAKNHYKIAYEIANKLKNEILSLIFKGNLGIMESYAGNINAAEILLKDTIKTAIETNVSVYENYAEFYLAQNYFYKSEFEKAWELTSKLDKILQSSENFDLKCNNEVLKFEIYSFLGILHRFEESLDNFIKEVKKAGFEKVLPKLQLLKSKLLLEKKNADLALKTLKDVRSFALSHSNNFILAITENRLFSLNELTIEELTSTIEFVKSQELNWLLLEIYTNLVLHGDKKYLEEIRKRIKTSENLISNYKIKLRLSNYDSEYKKDSEEIIRETNLKVEKINLEFNPKIYGV